MNPPASPAAPPAAAHELSDAPTPLLWRLALLAVAGGLGTAAYFSYRVLGPRAQAGLGAVCFLTLAAAFSANLRAVNWRTIGMGIVLQLLLAWFVLRNDTVREAFRAAGGAVETLLSYSDAGAKFV